ncbi:MAG TPA: hypothetical protein VGI20_07275, partial [Rhizomicrobium sp.]
MHGGVLLRVPVRLGWLCTGLAVLFPAGFVGVANAQTVDYFATPWVVAPIPSESTNPTSSAVPTNAVPNQRPSSYSNLYAQSLAASAGNTAPLQYVFNLGVDEVATDNVAESDSGRKADLGSLFSAGGTVTADTARLTGILSATADYEHYIEDTDLDHFSEYA